MEFKFSSQPQHFPKPQAVTGSPSHAVLKWNLNEAKKLNNEENQKGTSLSQQKDKHSLKTDSECALSSQPAHVCFKWQMPKKSISPQKTALSGQGSHTVQSNMGK